MFEVEWTGKYPTFCHGKWVIRKNGVVVDLPDDVARSSMNTKAEYTQWIYDPEGSYSYSDENGDEFAEWIANNSWVEAIATTIEEQKELYYKILERDWRRGSCGGCL